MGNSPRHALSENVKLGRKLDISFAHVSIFRRQIGRNRENHDKIKFRAQVPSKHHTTDRIH